MPRVDFLTIALARHAGMTYTLVMNNAAKRFMANLIADLRTRAATETDPAHKAKLEKAADWYEARQA